ncbi:MAG: serpin family protein [Deltaproteobacteria bacterium]|nr:serpin family protein [Deltaproteobacteria bacterium]
MCPPSFAQGEGAQPRADEAGLALSKANNKVAIELYRKLARDTRGNLFFSPLSISSALSMSYAGAKSTTAAEFETALKYPYKGTELLKAQKNLSDALLAVSKGGPEFVLANSLWPDFETKILDSYSTEIDKYFGPLIFPVDYKNDESGARDKINDWVDSTTKGRITNFLSSPLKTDTRLLLVNAVYFKGDWEQEFPESRTKGDKFRTPSSKVPALFMHNEGYFNYLEEPNLQVLELLYKGKNISMLILLPKNDSATIEDIEKSLSADDVEKWLSTMRDVKGKVALPRFKITWGAESVKGALEGLGLKRPFTDEADFSGITGDKLFAVDDVVHKAFVEVNEKGTEAAAASGMMSALMGGIAEVFEFTADHPFIFLIVDKETNNIIFIGKLSNPS